MRNVQWFKDPWSLFLVCREAPNLILNIVLINYFMFTSVVN